MVVERSVAARDRLQAVVEVEHDLVQRQLVDEHHALLGDVLELLLHAALLFEQGEDAAEVVVRREDGRLDDRLFDLGDADGVGHLRGRIDLDHLAVGRRHAVAHAGRGRDEVEIELALKPLLHDLHVEEAEEAAAEAEAERDRRLRLVEEGGVVQAQLVERVAQLLVLVRLDRVEAGEDHRLDLLKAGEGDGSRARGLRDRVADLHVGHRLDRGGEEADLAAPRGGRWASGAGG